MQESQSVILCMRVADCYLPPTAILTKAKCTDCLEAVWLAPSSLKVTETIPGTRILCNVCGPKALRETEDPLFCIAPGAIEEMRSFRETVRNN